jgi:predicted TIM-barrel fold metal-dependent hydrolase
VRRHPRTIFYGAHVGNYAENLTWVADMLDECPNYYVDISERIPELGRQPRAARRFFIDYQDRILFGTDRPAIEEHVLPTWYRLLETADEYFEYSPDPLPRQGRWRVYGLDLPKDVLRKVYAENARAIIPGA